jgi:hypothetical protein
MRVLREGSKEDKRRCIVVYGPGGVGKTTLGVTSSDPLFFLSQASARGSVIEAAESLGKKTPPMFLLEEMKDLVEALRACHSPNPAQYMARYSFNSDKDRESKVKAYLKTLPSQRPQTIVWDNMTDFCRIIAEAIDKASPPKIGKDGLPTRNEKYWQVLRERCERFIRQLSEVPYHVLFLAQMDDRVIGDSEDQRTRKVGPDLPVRSLASVLASVSNAVGRLRTFTEVDQDEEKLLFRTVCFSGPDWVLTKKFGGLYDYEVPNVAHWIESRKDKKKIPASVDVGQGHKVVKRSSMPSSANEKKKGSAPPPQETNEEEQPPTDQQGEDQDSGKEKTLCTIEPLDESEKRPSTSQELLNVVRGKVAFCAGIEDLARVWYEYLQEIERCREKAPRTFQRLDAMFKAVIDRIIEDGIRDGKMKFGEVTNEDIMVEVIELVNELKKTGTVSEEQNEESVNG